MSAEGHGTALAKGQHTTASHRPLLLNAPRVQRTAPLPKSKWGRFCILAGLRAILRLRSQPLDWKSVGARVVVFAPHADDESLGAGGFIALRCSAGLTTDVVVVTDGTAAREGDTLRGSLNLARLRRNEAIRAANALSLPLEHLHFIGQPEGTFGNLSREDYLRVRDSIVTLLRRIQPDAVLLPHFRDGHPEHTSVYELVRSACGELPGRALYTFPIWSAWSPPLLLHHLLNRRHIFRLPKGISHTEAKAKALAAYETQFTTQAPFPTPLMPRGFMRIFVDADEYFFCD